jgi:regulation of enolase protein 1 (concanavalin A-like superfamily)
VSVVVADPYSDWSLWPAPVAASFDPPSQTTIPNDGKFRISLERRGPHVVIGYRVNDGPVHVVRQIRGFATGSPEGSWHVGVAINKPGREHAEGLEVEFERFELEYF